MRKTNRLIRGFSVVPRATTVVIACGVLAVQCAQAQTTWTAVSGTAANLNWSTAANWSTGVIPGPFTGVVFDGTTAVSSSPFATPGNGGVGVTGSLFNSFVDGDHEITGLMYENVNGTWQNLMLNSSDILNIAGGGGLVVGNGLSHIDYGSAQNVTIAGSSGELIVNNNNAYVWVTMGGAAAETATLDLSGLGTFSATVNQFMVGVAGNNRPTGVVYLAHNNSITATFQTTSTEANDANGNGAIVVGDSASNPGGKDGLYLGYQNDISAGTIITGRQKVPSAVIQFNPIYIFDGFGPSATFNGYPAAAAQVWSIGDGVANGGTANCTGTNDFSLGAVNANVATMYVGRAAASAAGTGTATGDLTFGSGKFDITTLYVGYQPVSSVKIGIGTVNVTYTALPFTGQSSGALDVAGTLYLAETSGGQGAASTSGTLTITNGASALIGTIVAGGGVSTINLGSPFTTFGGAPAGGTLTLGLQAGAPNLPISAINLFEGAAMHLNLDGGATPIRTNIVATAVNDYDATTIVIDSITGVASGASVTFPLIAYQGSDPFNNFFLGTLPSGYYGTLVDNSDDSRIDLQVTQGEVSPTISPAPASQSICAGNIATFTVAASGTGPLTFRWQYNMGGDIWYDVSSGYVEGAFTPVLSFPAEASQTGYQYRAIVSNSGGSMTNSAATLTVNSAPAVTTSPVSQSVDDGQTATFTTAASGVPSPTIQWQSSADGGTTWAPIAGATSTTLTIPVDVTLNGNQYQAVFMNSCGNATTAAATLTVPLAFVQQPASQTFCAGSTASFTVSVTGASLSYQWQSSANGLTWQNIGANSATLNFTADYSQNGYQYRVIVSSGDGIVTSDIATLSVDTETPDIGLSPVDQTVASGQTVTFTSEGTGPVDLSIQWVVSSDGGMKWTAIPGATSEVLTFTADASQNGYQYLAVYMDACAPLETTPARLIISCTPIITANPAGQTVSSGQTATFTAAATSTPVPSVQWQVSTDNGNTWNNISGATSTTFSFTVDPSENGNEYQAVFTDSCGSTATAPATLTVSKPTLTITPVSTSMVYGSAVPTFSVIYTGFINGDTSASLTTQPTVSTTGTSTSPVGAYPITATSAADPNYTIVYVAGTLTVTPATPVITWVNPASIAIDTPIGDIQLDATANVPGNFVYNPPFGTIVPGGMQILSTTFTPSDSLDYTTVNASATIEVTGCQETPSGLVSWWKAEGNAFDVVGGNTGTLENGATYLAGEVGQAFSFNADSAMVEVGSAANLQLQTFTIEAWIQRASMTASSSDATAANGIGMLFGFGAGGYGFGMLPDGDLVLAQVGGSSVGAVAAAITDAGWHHVAVTTSDGTVVFYIDGVAYPATGNFSPTWAFTTPATIGGRADNINANDNESFLGAIDEISVYSRALSVEEMTLLFDAGSGGKCLPTVTVSWANPANMVYGTPLTGVQLNATANVAGSFTYDPPAGTVLPFGEIQTLQVVFTPTDTADFPNSVTQTVAINVQLAPPIITAPSSVCADSTGNSASGPPGMSSYAWTITDSACADCSSVSTITTGANAQTVTWTADDSPSETLALTVTDASGNAGQNSAAITVNPAPSMPYIPPPPGVCGNSTGNTATAYMSADVPYPDGYTYTWTINNGVITSGANASTVNYTAGPSGNVTLYATVVSSSGCTSETAMSSIFINPLPVPAANLWGTVVGHFITEPAANLLDHATGVGLSVSAVSPASAQGGTVTLVNGVITYTPPTGFVGQDQFSYTLNAGCGPVQGTVSVNVITAAPPPQYQVAIPLVSTCVNLLYSGISGQQYVVQWESTLNGPWMSLSGTLIADANGLVSYSDCRSPLPSSGFYRVQGYTPPGMVFVPAGTFTMGDALDGESDATPTITVTVSGFYMDTNLVSYSQWQSIYNWATTQGYGFVNSGAGKAASHPVQMVDWFDAVKWCNARSQQAGLTPVYYTDPGFTQVYTTGEIAPYVNWSADGFRLPTEAEWEKAARGGSSGQRFPWGNTISESQANYDGNIGEFSYDLGPTGYNAIFDTIAQPFTSPVGYFSPNGYGFYDMAGNVQGFCWDWYGTTYAGGSDPEGPTSGTERVVRGGNWNFNASYSRCANRHLVPPTYISNYIGLRCVIGP